MVKLPIVTQSQIRAFRACDRLHHIRYELGYQTVQSVHALEFGKAWDTIMRAWWAPIPRDRRQAALEAWSSLKTMDPFDHQKLLVMFYGYHERWADAPYACVGAGVQFECEIINPDTGHASRTFMLAGELDGLARDSQDRIWILEHKTSSEDIGPGANYWRRLTMDPQVSAYYAGARSLGYEPAGCLYDVVKKPMLRPLQANKSRSEPETPEQYRDRCLADITGDPMAYYARGEIVRLEADEQESAYDVWHTVQSLRESQRAGRHPRNPDACIRYGRTCEYFDVCTRAASLDDPLRFKKLDNVHPELKP
jgi:hypothetical protein